MAPAPKFSPLQQEKMILQAAADSIEERSLLDFSMADIAKRAGLSMGSVYKHVQCKEDVLIALSSLEHNHQIELFRRLLTLPLNTPQRIISVSLLDHIKAQKFSFGMQLDNLVKNPDLQRKCSQKWLDRMFNASKHCECVFGESFSKALSEGEFMSSEEEAHELNIACWAMTVGYLNSVHHHLVWSEQDEPGVAPLAACLAPDSAIIQAQKRLINAYKWAEPLTDAGLEHICQVLAEQGLR